MRKDFLARSRWTTDWVFLGFATFYFLAGAACFYCFVVAGSLYDESLLLVGLGASCLIVAATFIWEGNLLRYPVMWCVLRKASSSAMVNCKSGRDFVEVYFSDR